MNSQDYVSLLLEKVHAQFGEDPLPKDLLTRFPKITGPAGKDLTAQDLYAHPALQEALAFKVHYTPSKWLLEQESEAITKLRGLHNPGDAIPYMRTAPVAGMPQWKSQDIYDWARERRLAGICFSGGGIRSATFNLGVLQGLAKRDWLHRFDYLSSVSGGGYIHSWLAAWLKRRSLQERDRLNATSVTQQDAQTAFERVKYRLKPLPERPPEGSYQTVWPRQIRWLRSYSNYLTPHVGLFGSDIWSAIAIWIRNVSLNQTLLIAIFLAILCLPHLLAPAVRLQSVHPTAGLGWQTLGWLCPHPAALIAPGSNHFAAGSFAQHFSRYWHGGAHGLRGFLSLLTAIHQETAVALGCFFVGTLLIGLLLRGEYHLGCLPNASSESFSRRVFRLRGHQVFAANFMLGLLMAFALLLTLAIFKHRENLNFPAAIFLLLLGLVWTETFAGGALGQVMTVHTQSRQRRGENEIRPTGLGCLGRAFVLGVLGIPAALAGAVGSVAIAALLHCDLMQRAARFLMLDGSCSLQIVAGTLLFFWLVPVTMIVASGLIGTDFPDWLGEWLGRIRGYSLLMGGGWLFLCGASLLMPGLLLYIHYGSHGLIKWPAFFTWAGTTLVSVMGGKSPKTSGKEAPSTSIGGTLLNAVVLVGPYVYIGGLVLLLSLLLELVHAPLTDGFFGGHDLLFWLSTIGCCLVLAGLLGYRLDINEFSMHSLYRNRLTRCYLGASNLTRSPSPVTGFDQRDTADLQIAHMTLEDGYPGPIPIFCCAMNITMGEELAWQERKAASFAFTPFYSGYTVGWTGANNNIRFNGFVPTKFLLEGDPNQSRAIGGPNIATAMAASGAAVSPNMGYHTNPGTAFLMTMFDVRLGLWVPNPRRSELAGETLNTPPRRSYRASPRFAPWWLASELLGSVNDTSKYVYLTDGGHFDNMGLYELVRRRCYDIVICDAEEDGDYSFEGIGNSIRRCRIDFGVEIGLNLSALSPNTHSRLSPAHIIRGTIRYPETPDSEAGEGEILYIKASLTGAATATPLPMGVKGNVELPNVPGDVQNYKLQHAYFPHDSTAEQWFTESQFESYRRLGETIVDGLDRLV